MVETINERIAVISSCHPTTLKIIPVKLKWRGRVFLIEEIGFHHPVREGRLMHHIFEVTDGNLAFRLKLDTESLQWTLEKISDGNPD